MHSRAYVRSDTGAVQVAAEPLAQPAPGDADADGVGEAVGGGHADHGPAGGQHDVSRAAEAAALTAATMTVL